ncbi:hypothetical protein [Bradyrhizobium sp. BR 10289]|uniref:hypothetical protein n=1 Tax=Bradyrhizobium sp. BR 10289 TaxID=2749993 RepID=UPI001C645360|nr:hypothetical protein [Bradyrhizobium sp. BR 10289]MBW7970097.1 hypothetical protein [Bradyrhizobium sp. BR 10289]
MIEAIDRLRTLANDAEANARRIAGHPFKQSQFIDFAMKLHLLAGEAAKLCSEHGGLIEGTSRCLNCSEKCVQRRSA